MNRQNEENLKELFGKFVSAEQAERFADDVHRAEQILRAYPAPEPDDAVLFKIKSEIAASLARRKACVWRKRAYELAATAAAVIILAAIGVKLLEKGGEQTDRQYAFIIPAAIWESEDITADDEGLASLTAEVEQIESAVLSLRLGEDSGNGNRAVTELEMEMIEINSSFWKG